MSSALKYIFSAKFLRYFIEIVVFILPFLKSGKKSALEVTSFVESTTKGLVEAFVDNNSSYVAYFGAACDILQELIIEDDEVNPKIVADALVKLKIKFASSEEVGYFLTTVLSIYSIMRDKFPILKDNVISDSEHLAAFVKGVEKAIGKK